MTTSISTLEQLQAMKDNLAGDYVLLNSIPAAATSTWNGGLGFEPVGNDTTPFTGTFNGRGFLIDGLVINRPTQDRIGLFGTVSTGVVEQVGVVNATIVGRYRVAPLVGSLSSLGTVRRCHASGSAYGDEWIGGLVGALTGDAVAPLGISDSFSLTTTDASTAPSGYLFAGGLAGYQQGDIHRCYAAGVCGPNAAAFTGARNGGWPVDCYFDEEVTGTYITAGGTSKTTAEMKQQATFVNWDFTDIWQINEGVDYPRLQVDPLAGWLTYTGPIPVQDGTLEWFGIDAVGNAEAIKSVVYELIKGNRKFFINGEWLARSEKFFINGEWVDHHERNFIDGEWK